jgi:hypothetical protein
MKSLGKFARVLKLVLIYFVVMIVFVSCGEDEKENPNGNGDNKFSWDSNVDVYTVGYEIDDGQNKLVLWKNDQQQILENNVVLNNSSAASVFVNGNDVYVAGYVNERAVLWKNGAKQELGDYPSQALSVFVDGNDVYVAGRHSSDARVLLWKNGMQQTLVDSIGGAYSVFVHNGDVYVGGFTIIDYYSCPAYWKNGGLNVLSITTSNASASVVNSIFADNNNVYAAGGPYNRGVLWTNGTPDTLSTSSYLQSVFVYNGDVYAIAPGPALFKNKVKQTLESGWTPSGLYVSNNNVYICGQDNYRAVLYKNGIKKYLGKDNSESMATAIFVKAKY